MNSGKHVFAQLVQYVNKYEFEKCETRYMGAHRVSRLNCRTNLETYIYKEFISYILLHCKSNNIICKVLF